MSAIPPRRDGDYDQETIVREERQDVVTPGGGIVGQDVTVAEQVDREGARRDTADWLTGLITFLIGLVAILIAIRVVLKLLAANPDSGFARFIYGVSGPLVAPFAGIFGAPAAGNGAVLELPSILALAIYLLIGWLLAKLARLVVARPASGVSATRTTGRRTRP